MGYNGNSDNTDYSRYAADYTYSSYCMVGRSEYTYYSESSGYQSSPEVDYELRKEQAIKDNFGKYEERLNSNLHLTHDEKIKALESLAEEDNYQEYTPYGK